MAETAVSMLPWPEIITTGSSACSCLIAPSNCRPSSLLPWSQMSRNTRFGRRAAMAASAWSLFFAVRVPWPSSWRMPATSSRISASSSTIRISDDMAHLSVACGFADFGGSLFVGGTFGAEAQPGPSPSAVPVGSIIELDASAVLLEDAADDREPEAGTLLARRHIGLEQAVAVLLRQTGAVVDDVDNDVGPLACRRYLDPATAELFRRHRRDRL